MCISIYTYVYIYIYIVLCVLLHQTEKFCWGQRPSRSQSLQPARRVVANMGACGDNMYRYIYIYIYIHISTYIYIYMS